MQNMQNMSKKTILVQKIVYLALRPLFLELCGMIAMSSSSSVSSAVALLAVFLAAAAAAAAAPAAPAGEGAAGAAGPARLARFQAPRGMESKLSTSKLSRKRKFSAASVLFTTVVAGCASFAARYSCTASAPNFGDILMVLI